MLNMYGLIGHDLNTPTFAHITLHATTKYRIFIVWVVSVNKQYMIPSKR